MKLIRKLVYIFDSTVNLLALVTAVLLVYIMLIISTEVASRYFIGHSIIWAIETTEYSLLGITFLGAAWLLREEGHVRMDMLLERLPARAQALINIVTSVLGALTCLVITWYSVWRTWDFFQISYTLCSVLRTPISPLLSIVSLGTFLLFIQFLIRTYGYIKQFKAVSDNKQN